MLITERVGTMRLVSASDGSAVEVAGVPEVVASGQGGLLDVALDPAFGENQVVYLSYAEPRSEGAATAVGRGRLDLSDSPRLVEFKTIFQMNIASGGGRHFGSRLVFAPDGTLFITTGDRGQRNRSQDSEDHAGAVIRINADGSIPADNPFVGRAGADEIWSIGHRNPQGAPLDPETGALWTVEHGARAVTRSTNRWRD